VVSAYIIKRNKERNKKKRKEIKRKGLVATRVMVA
jgi:hypothetical protein